MVLSDAQVLELCVSNNTKPNLKHSALVLTRRALRRLFNKGSDTGKDVIEAVVFRLTEKSQPLGLRSAIFLGVIAGVCARLPAKRSVLEACKDQYYSFFVREIIGSRSAVPQHVAAAFEDLFQNFTTVEDLLTVLSPAFEKALLRAPEVVLDLIPPLVVSLHPTVDLAQVLAEHLLKPLLSNIKSQNSDIRNGAFSAFSVLVGRSRDQSYIEMVLGEILTPLRTSKLASADQRALHARMISQIQVSLQPPRLRAVCEQLVQVLAKEPNEMALGAEANALTHNFSSYFISGSETVPDNFFLIVDAYVKGLSDKRPGPRKAWALRIGDLLWSLTFPSSNPPTVQFVEAIAPKFLDNFDEIVLNPQNAGQSGLLVIAYVTTAMSKLMLDAVQGEKVRSLIFKAKIHKRAFSLSPKPSFLLNHRLYTKSLDYDGCVWMIRALEACSDGLSILEQALPTSDAWVQALLFLMTASEVSFEVQKRAVSAMTNAYFERPALIGNLVVQGLWTWYRNVETGQRDTAAIAARTGNTKLHLAVRSICPLPIEAIGTTIESDILQTQLTNMLVLCRPEILPNISWIEVCLRVGQDPGYLARSRGIQCLERVESCRSFAETGNSSLLSTIELAANNTAADLAFVAPDTITPLLLERIEMDLSPEDVYKYGPTEVAISRTPEGTPFIDVISKESRGLTVDKSSRDYDTIKWEEEVRRQVAQKRGQEKKLTPDEKARVNTQLAKESAIRQELKKLERRLKKGIGLVYALATGPPTDAGMWLGRSLKALLGIITARAGNIVGSAADDVYIVCASLVSSRLGTLRRFIGIATLRALGFSALQPQLEQEPLGGEKALLSTGLRRLTRVQVL